MLSRVTRSLVWLLPLACSSSPTAQSSAAASTHIVNMQFGRASFYAAPFPSDDLVKADGTIDIEGFPNPNNAPLVVMAKQLAAAAHGFAEEGAVYFTLSGSVDASLLPDMATTVKPGAKVFVLDVQPGSPDYLKPVPVTVRFDADGGPFGDANMLSLLPLQGTPMRAKTTYAAVVTTGLGFDPSPSMTSIAAGTRPTALPQKAFAEYQAALVALAKAGIAASDVAGLAVFTTDDPTAQLKVVLDDAVAHHLPVPDKAFKQTDLFPTFCVYESTLPMPDYQAGSSPYNFECAADDATCVKGGGDWQFDAAGHPILQRTEEAGIVITIPRSPMPAAGWPMAHFIRTGGGGTAEPGKQLRPLVDRGAMATNGGPGAPGTGPALYFAMAGLAGAEVDGPHENLRDLTGENEDFLMFNIFNPKAMRDNVRESGVEYALFAHLLEKLTLDVSDCPGTTSPAKFDAARFALMGHSMGATIAPLSLAFEPLYRIMVASGSGASWIENVIWKQKPLPVAGDVSVVLGYTSARRKLTEQDPVLTLFQWGEEPADSDVYSRLLVAEPPAGMEPRHWLMEQGIVDHYIMPPIANAMSLSLALDLTGTPLDATSSELETDGTPTLESLLPYSGGKQIPLPVSGNRKSQGKTLTTLVTQHPADGIEDGHEIVFQTDPPKREYRCFLQTWAAGQTPIVPNAGAVDGPCQ